MKGINDYQNDIGALKFCVVDVEDFRQALVNGVGFKEDGAFLMIRLSSHIPNNLAAFLCERPNTIILSVLIRGENYG
jgi:hypothetical protein